MQENQIMKDQWPLDNGIEKLVTGELACAKMSWYSVRESPFHGESGFHGKTGCL